MGPLSRVWLTLEGAIGSEENQQDEQAWDEQPSSRKETMVISRKMEATFEVLVVRNVPCLNGKCSLPQRNLSNSARLFQHNSKCTSVSVNKKVVQKLRILTFKNILQQENWSIS